MEITILKEEFSLTPATEIYIEWWALSSLSSNILSIQTKVLNFIMEHLMPSFEVPQVFNLTDFSSYYASSPISA